MDSRCGMGARAVWQGGKKYLGTVGIIEIYNKFREVLRERHRVSSRRLRGDGGDMSGEEIVIALRCCASVDGTGCAKCSDKELNNDELLSCADVLKNAAADLIENQQNHIRALLQANDALRPA